MQKDAGRLHANLFTEQLLKKDVDTQNLTIDSINQNYHYQFCPGLFQVFAVKTDSGYEDQYNNAIKILDDKIVQILNTLLRDSCLDMGIYLDDSVIYCVMNYESEEKRVYGSK